MRRTELKRKTGIKATAFKKKVPDLALKAATQAAKKCGLPTENKPAAKPRKKLRATRSRSTAIRRSARGEDCQIRIPGVCNHDPDTTVLCHSNQLADGKGMGLKAPDTAAAYGCSACHDVLDGRAPMPGWLTRAVLLALFAVAIAMTHQKLKTKGLLK